MLSFADHIQVINKFEEIKLKIQVCIINLKFKLTYYRIKKTILKWMLPFQPNLSFPDNYGPLTFIKLTFGIEAVTNKNKTKFVYEVNPLNRLLNMSLIVIY